MEQKNADLVHSATSSQREFLNFDTQLWSSTQLPAGSTPDTSIFNRGQEPKQIHAAGTCPSTGSFFVLVQNSDHTWSSNESLRRGGATGGPPHGPRTDDCASPKHACRDSEFIGTTKRSHARPRLRHVVPGQVHPLRCVHRRVLGINHPELLVHSPTRTHLCADADVSTHAHALVSAR